MITITTTTRLEAIDDLIDQLEALKEISVDHLEISGTIDFAALAHERVEAAAEALQPSPAVVDEIAGIYSHPFLADVVAEPDADDLACHSLDQLTQSERVGLLGDHWVTSKRFSNLDICFLETRRERIIDIAAAESHRYQLTQGLVQDYFPRDQRERATEELYSIIATMREQATDELIDTVERNEAARS